MNLPKIKVIAYSDYICPFCYIGYHRIEQLKKTYDLEVEWKPFEIHPETPREGASIEDLPFPKGYLETAFANVRRLAKEDGLELNFSNKLPNSRLALFISEFARNEGKFEEFHKLVLESYWLQGKDIGNKHLLLNLAESIGLDRNKVENYLSTDEPLNSLRQSLKEVKSLGINGVPAFLIEDTLVFGAQPYEIFDQVIKKILMERS